jgi:hypothetical protein
VETLVKKVRFLIPKTMGKSLNGFKKKVTWSGLSFEMVMVAVHERYREDS